MHVYASPQVTATSHRVNKRLVIPKLLFLPMIFFALVSESAYVEYGFWDTTWEVVAFLLLVVAAIGRLWTSAYISGRKNNELVADGPYSLTRNPLYFFSSLGYMGAGLAFEKVSVALAFLVLFLLLHWPTILYEERKLRSKFGEEFDQYAREVPRFLPRLRKMVLLDTVTFKPVIFNRAVLDCTLILSVYGLAHAMEYFQNIGVIPILIRNVP